MRFGQQVKVNTLKTRNSTIAILASSFLITGAGFLRAATPVLPQEPIEIYKQGDPAKGAKIFKNICSACHTLGKGTRVGPDLASIHKRRSRDWLHRFIPSSTKMIASGDADAVAVFEKFNKQVMPDQAFTTAQLDSLLAYIESVGGEANAPIIVDMSKPEGNPVRGAALFEGLQRLGSGGPACNSCHGLQHEVVIAGGSLGVDLTQAYRRLGKEGLEAILTSPPFPLMKRAYQTHPIDKKESTALIAFLWETAVEMESVPPGEGTDWGLVLFFGGAVGAGVILALLGFLWRGRKTTLVNAKIFERQVGQVRVSD
jgi:mono/diheme cytochrome c family protein